MKTKEPNNILVLEGVTKRYKDLLALDNISFALQQGDIFGYIGPNGAGKTTTIKIIVGLLRQGQGTVSIGGYLMPEKKDQVNKLLGYLPQQVSFQQWRTVDHALTTFGKLSGLKKNELEARIQEVLSLLNLSEVRFKKIIELSGGTIQKVGLAQALLHHPKLLILDEPLGGLDPTSRYQVKEILRDLSKNGTTIFFSSHILSDVQDIATMIGVLNWGHLMQIGTLDELIAQFPKKNEIEIVLSKDSRKWNELQSMKQIQKIEESAPHKILVHLQSNADVDEMVHQLIKKLLTLGCQIRSIRPLSPNLDEVYLQYVKGGGNQ
jgi:ABC-2 type transport system ATP-binding protein